MSIQGSVNQMLGTGAAMVSAKKVLQQKQIQAQQRQLTLDERKRKQALKEQQQQLAAQKKQTQERTKLMEDVKKNYSQFAGFSNEAKMSLIQQIPELKEKLQQIQKLGGNK